MLDFFKKTKSFFVAYQKTVILTIISSSLMIIFLKLKKKSKKLIDNNENLNIETLNKTNNISSQPKFQTKASFKEMSVKDLLELKAKDISKTIKIQYENNYLDYSTIHQIMEKTIILCQYEYNHQTEENRILRRLIMNQENEYEQEIFKYLSEINKIINEDSLLILNALQLNTDLLENSISYLKNNTEMNEKIIGLKNNVIHLLKQGLISKNCLNLNLNKEILKFQIELFKNKSSNFKKIVNDLKESFESAQIIPEIIGYYIQDLVFLQFGIEEEDQVHFINNNTLDMETNKLIKSLERNIHNFFNKYGLKTNFYYFFLFFIFLITI